MKAKYIKPETKVIKIESQAILQASYINVNDEDGVYSTYPAY